MPVFMLEPNKILDNYRRIKTEKTIEKELARQAPFEKVGVYDSLKRLEAEGTAEERMWKEHGEHTEFANRMKRIFDENRKYNLINPYPNQIIYAKNLSHTETDLSKLITPYARVIQ